RLGGFLRPPVALEPALAQLVLLFRGESPQSLEGFPGGLALVRRHGGPVADAPLEALALDRPPVGISAGSRLEALLLVPRHPLPIRGNGPEDPLFVRAQCRPGGPRRLEVVASPGMGDQGRPGEEQRADQPCDLPSHARKSGSRKAAGGSSWVRSWASISARSASEGPCIWIARVASNATTGTARSTRCRKENRSAAPAETMPSQPPGSR